MQSDHLIVKYKGYNILLGKVKTEPKVGKKVIVRDKCLLDLLFYLDRNESKLFLADKGSHFEVVGIQGKITLKLKGKKDLSYIENQDLFGGKAKVSSAMGFDLPMAEGGLETLIFVFLLVLFALFLYPIYKLVAKPFTDWVIRNLFGNELLEYGYDTSIYVRVDTFDKEYDSKLKKLLLCLKNGLWDIQDPPCTVSKVISKEEFRSNKILNKRISNGRSFLYASVMIPLSFVFYLSIFAALSLSLPMFATFLKLVISLELRFFLIGLGLAFFLSGFWLLSKARSDLNKSVDRDTNECK